MEWDEKSILQKSVFLIFKVTDFCFIDRAWKTNKHKNTAMELRSSILFFAILREDPIANCLSDKNVQNRFEIGRKIKKLSRF